MSVVFRRKLTTKLPCLSPILLGWFESFALQNIQTFFNNEVTNVNVCMLRSQELDSVLGRKELGREKSTKTLLQDAKQAKGHSKWQN